MAAEHGWLYEPIHERLTWGFRLKTSDWTFEALSRSSGKETSPGSTDISMSTTWQAPRTGRTVLIGALQSNVNLGNMGAILTQQVLHLALGSQADGLTEIQPILGINSQAALRQKYMLWAQEVSDCEKLLSPTVESALLNWKGKEPLVKLTSSGLSIQIQGEHVKKPEKIIAIIQLGEALLAALSTR